MGKASLAGLLLLAVAGCTQDKSWHETEITGALPNLQLAMTRAKDHKAVTAADYRGKVTLLYFGYTFCPDVCPTTMANVARILEGLGNLARQVRVLFVTVDPNRDTLKVLNQYANAFAPQVDGLRGTPDQLAALARRYRIAYSVTPSSDPAKYEVTHSSAIYVFDRKGTVRLLISSLGTAKPDVKGATADIRRLLGEGDTSGPLAWLWRLV
jgi:protein SCO1/2